MCHYCHVLKNNPRAPYHPSIRCLDCGNTYSQVLMIQRTYNRGQPISLLPSAPPVEEQLVNQPISRKKTLCDWFKKIFTN